MPLIPEETPHVYIKPNFEDLPLSPAPLSDIQRNKMVYIGRLDENKGLHHLLDAGKKCRRNTNCIFMALGRWKP